MNAHSRWQELRDELAERHRAGQTIKFWLRDDDAIEPTEPLGKLLALSDEFEVPMTLAVIPALTGTRLADALSDKHNIAVAVHGWSHTNHAPEPEKKQELGPHRAIETIASELHRGFLLLNGLHSERFVPVLVPPWNRVATALLPELPAIGFRAISVYGKAKNAGFLPQINTHVDLMDWHGTRGCYPAEKLISDILMQIRLRTEDHPEPVGILAHHLVHDDAAWEFLRTLFSVTADTEGCQWVSLGELIET